MSLANGRHYLAIPGPSVMPDRVLQAMHRAAPNIYFGEVEEIAARVVADLKTVARTRHHVAMYVANGHGAWEAAAANVLAEGDLALVVCTGRFGHGWGNMVERIGASVERLDFGTQDPVDPARLAERLAVDTAHRIKAITVVQTDTATSIRSDIAAVRAAMDEAGHPALLMVDCIASLACDRFEMDAWGVDVMVAACQKGLMTPPGVGFVFYNDRAAAVRAAMPRVSSYWDWEPRVEPDYFYQYFNGTVPTHHMFGLHEALQMLVHEEGVEAAWARHATLARMVWAAFEAWGKGGPLAMNVRDPNVRSHAVTAAGLGAPHGTALRNWMSEKMGVSLGIGMGFVPDTDPAWHGYFRLGHMGHVNAHMVMGVLGTLEAGMRALEIPFGDGALAAASAVAAEG